MTSPAGDAAQGPGSGGSDVGETAAAGAGMSDDEFAGHVAGQTSSDLQAEAVFEREADGASTDEPAAEVNGDDLS